MAHLLLNLYRVPDDEADDVRRLLDQHRIAWYQTEPSPWGISHGGIWLSDESQLQRAQQLFDDYQSERSSRVRAEYAAARLAGSAPTFCAQLRQQPAYVLLVLLGILCVLGLLALPVWLLL